jgi:hypothetical protein
MTITALLDELRVSHLERGCAVDRHLQPGLSRDELLRRTRSLGFALPEDVVELYAWRNGQGADAEMSVDALVFRDQKFVDVAGALREYPLIQEHYAPKEDLIPYGFDLAEAFPFATFMGSAYVIVCGPHELASPDRHPIVSVFQGVDLFFHSLETMLRTCLDWVRHPDWGAASTLPDEVEQRIWQQHNPGFLPWGHGSWT